MKQRVKLLVDGVFFQRASTGIARVWKSILPIMAQRLEIRILDRGNTPAISGIDAIPFASHLDKVVGPTATESIAIEQLCRNWGADVFASTYYSTPLSTPALQMVHDMIPEVLGMDLSFRDWQEKELALLYGRAHVCVSHNTRADLLRLYPEIEPSRTTVAHCGVEPEIFFPRPNEEIDSFRRSLGIDGNYLLMTGSRFGTEGYKNGAHLFEALTGMDSRDDLTVLCVGGEADTPVVKMGGLQLPVKRVSLTDDDLSRAYAGAEALVYPSLYEGFGIPPAEAMACGCPVITTYHGSLAEVVGDAAIKVSGRDVGALRSALNSVRDPATRSRMVAAGLERSKAFRWEHMAEHVSERVIALASDAKDGRFDEFLQDWAVLRRLQADVDF